MSPKTFPFALSFAGLAAGGLSLAALAVSQGNGTSETQDVYVAPEDLAALTVPVCSIDLDTTSGGALLSASVTPEVAMTGTFALRVTRQMGGNRSSIRQGGAFSAPAGKTTVLSMSAFNNPTGIDASLTITAGGQTYECSFPGLPLDT
jgi:hypothetical protein